MVPVQQKSMEDLHSKVQRICSKAVEEDEATIQTMQQALKNFKAKADGV